MMVICPKPGQMSMMINPEPHLLNKPALEQFNFCQIAKLDIKKPASLADVRG
jgi:hypothetical protein